MKRPSPADVIDLLNDAPSAGRLVVIDREGARLGSAGGEVAADADDAVARLWEVGSRAAANRSPAPLDHLIVQTTLGAAVIVKHRDVLVAAVGLEGSRPDLLACELRQAAAAHLGGGREGEADPGEDAAIGVVRNGEA